MECINKEFFDKLNETLVSLVKEKGSCTREALRKKLSLSKEHDSIISFCFEAGMFPEYELRRRVGIRLKQEEKPKKEVKKRIMKPKSSLIKNLSEVGSESEDFEQVG